MHFYAFPRSWIENVAFEFDIGIISELLVLHHTYLKPVWVIGTTTVFRLCDSYFLLQENKLLLEKNGAHVARISVFEVCSKIRTFSFNMSYPQTFFFGGRYAPFVGLKWMLLVLDISAAFQGHFFFQSIWTRREKNMITVESWFLCMEKIRLRGGNPPLSAFRSPKVNNWGYSFQSHVYPPIYL